MTDTNANTSGLEVVAWRKNVWVADGIGTGWMLSNDQPEPHHLPTDIEPLVTAASAQAAIDAEKARADRLAQIARLLDECIWFNPDTQNFEVNHDGSVEKARAALQQETQP